MDFRYTNKALPPRINMVKKPDKIKKLENRIAIVEREFIDYEKLANLDTRVEDAFQIIATHLNISLSELFEVCRR